LPTQLACTAGKTSFHSTEMLLSRRATDPAGEATTTRTEFAFHWSSGRPKSRSNPGLSRFPDARYLSQQPLNSVAAAQQILSISSPRLPNAGVSRRAARPCRPGAETKTACKPMRFSPRDSTVGCTRG